MHEVEEVLRKVPGKHLAVDCSVGETLSSVFGPRDPPFLMPRTAFEMRGRGERYGE